MYTICRRAERDQSICQGLRYCYGASCGARGGEHEGSRPRELTDQIHIRTACGDKERLAQPLCEQASGHAVGVVIMGVDKVKIEALFLQAFESGQRAKRHAVGSNVHPHLWRQCIARMKHLQTVALLNARCGSKTRVGPKALGLERKPGHRRDHGCRNPPRIHQVA